MHEREDRWTPVPDWTAAAIEKADWSARAVEGLERVLVSGAIESAVREIAPGAGEAGLWQVTSGDPHVIRIARDRALVVSNRRLDVAEGWQAAGWAATMAGDAWLAIDIAGPAMADVIAEAVSADLNSGSPSASVRFAGLNGVLLVRADAERARLHVERATAPYLWRWLEMREG